MEKLILDQAVVVSAYTGYLICPQELLHGEIERRLGRAVMTHELGDELFLELVVRPAFRDDFISLYPLGKLIATKG